MKAQMVWTMEVFSHHGCMCVWHQRCATKHLLTKLHTTSPWQHTEEGDDEAEDKITARIDDVMIIYPRFPSGNVKTKRGCFQGCHPTMIMVMNERKLLSAQTITIWIVYELVTSDHDNSSVNDENDLAISTRPMLVLLVSILVVINGKIFLFAFHS